MKALRVASFCAGSAAALAVPASAQVDHSGLPVRAGAWTYGTSAGSSEALFSDVSRQSLASIRCIRATRRLAVSVRSLPAPSLVLWTSSAQRTLPATYNPSTGFLTAELPASDRLLDALAFSRGRFSIAAVQSAPLILPNWAEPTRAIEDCRN